MSAVPEDLCCEICRRDWNPIKPDAMEWWGARKMAMPDTEFAKMFCPSCFEVLATRSKGDH